MLSKAMAVLTTLTAASLLVLVGCSTAGEGRPGEKQASGKVISLSPCRTLMEVSVSNDDKSAKNLKFWINDITIRKSLRGIKKDEIVKIEYVIDAKTKRNYIKKIEKVETRRQRQEGEKVARQEITGIVVGVCPPGCHMTIRTEENKVLKFGVAPKAEKDVKGLKKGTKISLTYTIHPKSIEDLVVGIDKIEEVEKQ